MKRAIPWVVGLGAIALAVGFYVRGSQARPKEPAKIPAAPAAAAPAAPAEKIAYTFPDEAKMREFTELWQKRQSVAVRMAVLKDYWNGEQTSIAKFNTDLQSQYGFDPAKNYSLDTQKRVLLERKAPEAAAKPADQPAAAPAAGQPAPAAPAVASQAPAASEETAAAHTFATEDEMKAFATLWQQRQTANIRMAVLQSLWDEQKAELAKLSETVAATYKLDPAKNYSLDATRRALIEHEASPAQAPAAAAAQGGTPPATPAAPQTP